MYIEKKNLFKPILNGFLINTPSIELYLSKNSSKHKTIPKFSFINPNTISKIAFSKLKGGFNTKDVAYLREKDEWLIANDNVKRPQMGAYSSPEKVVRQAYEEVKIADRDELTWF